MLRSPYRALGQTNHHNIPSHPSSHGGASNMSAYPLDPTSFGSAKTHAREEEMMASDSEASSSASPRETRICFCGGMIVDGEGIYCSAACARSDAFSTLCNKPNPPSLTSSVSQSLSRDSSATSITTASSSAGTGSHESSSSDWESTHYGRMCRADLRREERREERRRRRAEGGSGASAASSAAGSIASSRGTMMSVASSASTSAPHRLPDLVGGAGSYNHNHSRNASIASSRTSYSSLGGLSRAPSNASSTSRRGYGGVHVDTVIMEDDDEEEWLASSDNGYDHRPPHPLPPSLPSAPKYRLQHPPHPHANPHSSSLQRRRPSHSKSHGGSRKKQLEPFGMGKDMRDVLEEIIQMEKEFVIDEASDDNGNSNSNGTEACAGPGLFTAVFDRPPRTPSPAPEGKRQSVVPGAPMRGHRKSMSMSTTLAYPFSPPQAPAALADDASRAARPRPPSMYGHSSSLSESHTALYLATASPETAARRSASPPRLKARNSMTFTPESAGPVIPGVPSFHMNTNWNSPSMATPSSRRRPGPGHSPTAHHPAMSGWRFPHSNTATPTKLTIDTTNLEAQAQAQARTPTRRAVSDHQPQQQQQPSYPHPQLLWPPNLAPSLFPTSPGMNGTPIVHSGGRVEEDEYDGFESASRFRQQVNTSPTATMTAHMSPPHSGLRLGYLLGSGDEDVEMDVEDDLTAHGHGYAHGHGHGFGVPGRQYLPVYLHDD